MSFGALETFPLAEFIEHEAAPDALWVFVHIPRTGGASLITELASFQPDHKFLLPGSDDETLPLPERLNGAVSAFVEELATAEYRACSGLIDMAQVARIGAVSANIRVVTMIRSPVDRVISEFRSLRSAPEPKYSEYVKKYPTIQAFADAPENWNRIATTLAPGSTAAGDVLKTIDENLAFVGLVEMYPMSFNIVSRLLGKSRLPQAKKQNVTISTERNRVETSSQLNHRIARRNELDLAVYEHIKHRLIDRREAWQEMQVQKRSVSATARPKITAPAVGKKRTKATVAQIRHMAELLSLRPQPLLDREKRLIVVWSPKSACTTTYVWFANLCGFVDEVEERGDFPHRHRVEVYMKSNRYRDTLKTDISDYHMVRILRDPYSRAVSIFRHALTTGFADEEAAPMGLDFKQEGVSFRQFLEFAHSQNLREGNAHLRPQVHRYELHRKPDTVINISKTNMFAELNTLEQRMGWPVTDFEAIAWLHQLEGGRRPDCEPFEGEHIEEIPMVRRLPQHIRFPTYAQLLTPAAKRMIERVYRLDFEAYRDFI